MLSHRRGKGRVLPGLHLSFLDLGVVLYGVGALFWWPGSGGELMPWMVRVSLGVSVFSLVWFRLHDILVISCVLFSCRSFHLLFHCALYPLIGYVFL